MTRLADRKQTLESTPNLAKGMSFAKIISAEFFPTKYKNQDGSIAQGASITVDANGNGQTTKYHTTSKAIVDTLNEYFIVEKNTTPLEQVRVIELRSANGRMYLTLEGF